ncbi:bifunctional diaminohydroxyphosphoribosylaminopyrimidine deaminase/5-amino-6-(5-phosphoribosylamino)uracil reductase RibD [Hyphomicrobium sp.]|uniref:bifunctional diaminohydroxyphosphoribosylaminopyrimidine deaminase/5-amino-6-(5-phosphoribosylamino)uracil reductase RibD n=1 Tax=Hyphomicrobium sp. TaxID=82 RepID=UPI003F715905
MSFTPFDHHMMSIALTLARRGLGTTAPNPSVGAVIADEATGEVISRGLTQPGGRPHAEAQALERAGQRARGATLYVTLEPCAHHGKTPPCADAVIAAGVRRVVIGAGDPDPRVAGEGSARLRAAGVAVDTGLLADDADWVTRGHILRVTERRPFVQLKMALSAEGDVPRGKGGAPKFVTGAEARAAGHLMRAEADAILVGSGTVRDDDPDLRCRLAGLEARSPVRVVVARSLDFPLSAKLFQTAREVPVWIFTGYGADAGEIQAYEATGAHIFNVPATGDGLSLPDVLESLAEAGITRLLVEGGPAMWRGFASAGLADEVVVFRQGSDPGANAASDELAARYAPGLDLALASERRIGSDRVSVFRARTQD